MTAQGTQWHIWIDRGGTFTDLVALTPDGHVRSTKLLSENAEQYDDAAIEGIRRLLGVAQDEILPEDRIAAVHMGTTVATNATPAGPSSLSATSAATSFDVPISLTDRTARYARFARR